VQRHAMEAWKGRAGFQELVGKDPLITRYLNDVEIKSCFDPGYYLRHLDTIYRRVFGRSGGKGARGLSRRRGTGRKRKA
jgi:adenylosuccinate lyase